jgi:hypothetical protein
MEYAEKVRSQFLSLRQAEAREAKQALALVEKAIRRRLLCASPDAVGRLTAVA